MRKKELKLNFYLFQIIRWPPPQRQVEKATAIEEVCSLLGVICFIDVSHQTSNCFRGRTRLLQQERIPLHAIAWYISFTLNDLEDVDDL